MNQLSTWIQGENEMVTALQLLWDDTGSQWWGEILPMGRARRANQVLQGVDCSESSRSASQAALQGMGTHVPAARIACSLVPVWEMVLSEEVVGKRKLVLFSTNSSPVFRLVSFRKNYLNNLRILKPIFFNTTYLPQTTWKILVYFQGYLYLLQFRNHLSSSAVLT